MDKEKLTVEVTSIVQGMITDVIATNLSEIFTMLYWIAGIGFAILVSIGVGLIKFGGYKEIFKKMRVDITDMSQKTNCIENYLHNIGGALNEPFNKYTVTNSPIALTEEGISLVQDSGFKSVIEEHPSIITAIVDEADDREDVASFIEKKAFETVEDLFEKDDKRVAKVSTYLYEHGLRHNEANFKSILQAFGVAVRDVAFKSKGIEG